MNLIEVDITQEDIANSLLKGEYKTPVEIAFNRQYFAYVIEFNPDGIFNIGQQEYEISEYLYFKLIHHASGSSRFEPCVVIFDAIKQKCDIL